MYNYYGVPYGNATPRPAHTPQPGFPYNRPPNGAHMTPMMKYPQHQKMPGYGNGNGNVNFEDKRKYYAYKSSGSRSSNREYEVEGHSGEEETPSSQEHRSVAGLEGASIGLDVKSELTGEGTVSHSGKGSTTDRGNDESSGDDIDEVANSTSFPGEEDRDSSRQKSSSSTANKKGAAQKVVGYDEDGDNWFNPENDADTFFGNEKNSAGSGGKRVKNGKQSDGHKRSGGNPHRSDGSSNGSAPLNRNGSGNTNGNDWGEPTYSPENEDTELKKGGSKFDSFGTKLRGVGKATANGTMQFAKKMRKRTERYATELRDYVQDQRSKSQSEPSSEEDEEAAAEQKRRKEANDAAQKDWDNNRWTRLIAEQTPASKLPKVTRTNQPAPTEQKPAEEVPESNSGASDLMDDDFAAFIQYQDVVQQPKPAAPPAAHSPPQENRSTSHAHAAPPQPLAIPSKPQYQPHQRAPHHTQAPAHVYTPTIMSPMQFNGGYPMRAFYGPIGIVGAQQAECNERQGGKGMEWCYKILNSIGMTRVKSPTPTNNRPVSAFQPVPPPVQQQQYNGVHGYQITNNAQYQQKWYHNQIAAARFDHRAVATATSRQEKDASSSDSSNSSASDNDEEEDEKSSQGSPLNARNDDETVAETEQNNHEEEEDEDDEHIRAANVGSPGNPEEGGTPGMPQSPANFKGAAAPARQVFNFAKPTEEPPKTDKSSTKQNLSVSKGDRMQENSRELSGLPGLLDYSIPSSALVPPRANPSERSTPHNRSIPHQRIKTSVTPSHPDSRSASRPRDTSPQSVSSKSTTRPSENSVSRVNGIPKSPNHVANGETNPLTQNNSRTKRTSKLNAVATDEMDFGDFSNFGDFSAFEQPATTPLKKYIASADDESPFNSQQKSKQKRLSQRPGEMPLDESKKKQVPPLISPPPNGDEMIVSTSTSPKSVEGYGSFFDGQW